MREPQILFMLTTKIKRYIEEKDDYSFAVVSCKINKNIPANLPTIKELFSYLILAYEGLIDTPIESVYDELLLVLTKEVNSKYRLKL